MNRRYSHMLTRGVNEIQLFVYIRSRSTNYFIIKKGGFLCAEGLNVVMVVARGDAREVALANKGLIMFPVVVYVCNKRISR